MKELEDIEIRSEEVQEILGTPPSWMVRWGSLSALALFVALMWLSFLVKYPDVVEDDIRLMPKNPPVSISAPSALTIEEVLIQNDMTVDSGRALIVFRSAANFQHILTLDDQLAAVKGRSDGELLKISVPSYYQLGEIQNELYAFQDVQSKFNSDKYKNLSNYDLRTSQIRINSLERGMIFQKEYKQQTLEQIAEAEQDRRNKEHLVSVGQASQEDVNKIIRKIMDFNKDLARIETEIRDRQSEITALKAKINSIKRGTDGDSNFASNLLRESFERLKASINTWKQRYILEAPTDGKVQIVASNVSNNSFVKQYEQLLSIVPTAKQETIGKMYIPFERSGKVKVHQKVIVQLESLEFPEYGVLEGEVSWKAFSPKDDGEKAELPVEIRFPQGMVTTAGKQVPTEELLSGHARIITEEKRFIERIFSGIRRYQSNF